MYTVSSSKGLAPADSSEEVSPVPLKCLRILLDLCAQTRGSGPQQMGRGGCTSELQPKKNRTRWFYEDG